MPDERDQPGTPRRGRAARRRSLETNGGISVSDVVERHTGQRPVFPAGAPETPAAPAGDAAPEPGPRPRPEQPRRARPDEPRARAPRQPQPDADVAPADATRQVRPPRPRQPRRTTAAAPLPEAPTQRRPPVANPGPQQTSAAPQPPRRARRAPLQAKGPDAVPDASAPRAADAAPRKQEPRRPAENAAPPRPKPNAVPPRSALDPLTMTDEMEAIDEATQYRRKIDHSLARFSAAHDEMEAEEAKRRERRERLTGRPAALIEQTRTALQRVVTTQSPLPDVAAAEQAEPEKAVLTRLQEKKQRHTDRAIRIGRISAIVVAALVFLGVGGAWGAINIFDAKFVQVQALDENSSDIQDAPAQNGDENFLMVGSDTRADASAEDGVGTADGIPGARSDTVMVAHIPADRKRVVMVSFPRDLEIDRPACARWDWGQNKPTDQTAPELKQQKLNTAFAIGGPPCTTKVIQQLTGLRINHFVGIDFSGFKDMVDAVQGVTVHNEIPIDDSVLGKVLMQTGDVQISGDTALNFVRARHVKGDPTSDYGRIKRQQEFIGALLKKVMSSDVVLDPGKLTGFITAFAKSTFGENLGVNQMITLAQSMKGLDPSKISFLTAPTVGIANSRGNEVLVKSRNDALFSALRTNAPLPDPNAPAPPSSSDSTPPSSTSSKSSSSGSSKSSSSGSKSSSRTSTHHATGTG